MVRMREGQERMREGQERMREEQERKRETYVSWILFVNTQTSDVWGIG
jgi:hypothetical protein